MSSFATAWAWHRDLSPMSKLVLLACAELADDQNTAAPTREQIATMTGASETTVARAIKEMVSSGILEPIGDVVRHVNGSARAITRYRLKVA